MKNRVRSRTHAGHEGHIISIDAAGTHAILWDSGAWSYLYADEFIRL